MCSSCDGDCCSCSCSSCCSSCDGCSILKIIDNLYKKKKTENIDEKVGY